MSQVSLPHSIASGDADNPTRDMANWTTIRDIINGNLDNTNIAAAAAIAISKTALGTFTDWTTYTPTLTQSGAVTKTVDFARYMQIGKLVTAQIHLVCTGAGTGNNIITISLPIASVYDNQVVGSGFVYNSDLNTVYSGIAKIPVSSTSTFALYDTTITAGNAQGIGVSTINFALAVDDEINAIIQYEVA